MTENKVQGEGLTYELFNLNKIQDMANNISNIPFKIDIDLLNYITGEKGKNMVLLMNPYTRDIFAYIKKY